MVKPSERCDVLSAHTQVQSGLTLEKLWSKDATAERVPNKIYRKRELKLRLVGEPAKEGSQKKRHSCLAVTLAKGHGMDSSVVLNLVVAPKIASQYLVK